MNLYWLCIISKHNFLSIQTKNCSWPNLNIKRRNFVSFQTKNYNWLILKIQTWRRISCIDVAQLQYYWLNSAFTAYRPTSDEERELPVPSLQTDGAHDPRSPTWEGEASPSPSLLPCCDSHYISSRWRTKRAATSFQSQYWVIMRQLFWYFPLWELAVMRVGSDVGQFLKTLWRNTADKLSCVCSFAISLNSSLVLYCYAASGFHPRFAHYTAIYDRKRSVGTDQPPRTCYSCGFLPNAFYCIPSHWYFEREYVITRGWCVG
jgi:hypothetical protein